MSYSPEFEVRARRIVKHALRVHSDFSTEWSRTYGRAWFAGVVYALGHARDSDSLQLRDQLDGIRVHLIACQE